MSKNAKSAVFPGDEMITNFCSISFKNAYKVNMDPSSDWQH